MDREIEQIKTRIRYTTLKEISMGKSKKLKVYSYQDSMDMLNRLQEMAIQEGNINLALKAEELKCKIASIHLEQENQEVKESITKILVDFINEKQNSENTGDICSVDKKEISL